MYTLAQTAYLDSQFGMECELPHAGNALENPYVYDASAQELKALATRGLIEVVCEQRAGPPGDELIRRFSFKRLR